MKKLNFLIKEAYIHLMKKITKKKKAPKSPIVTALVGIMFAMALIGTGFFLPAGTFLWLEAWVYLAILTVFFIFTITYLGKKDPELLNERKKMSPSESWDRVIIIVLSLSMLPWFIIPGFEVVRFGWTQLPLFVELIGFIGLSLSFVLIFLVMKENTYLAKTVKIQEERGHEVITMGPYKIVRHPMYTGFIGYFMFHCLALRSLYALIPGAVASILLIIRTIYEDKLLHEQLEGYTAYAKKTRYKIFPGIW